MTDTELCFLSKQGTPPLSWKPQGQEAMFARVEAMSVCMRDHQQGKGLALGACDSHLSHNVPAGPVRTPSGMRRNSQFFIPGPSLH